MVWFNTYRIGPIDTRNQNITPAIIAAYNIENARDLFAKSLDQGIREDVMSGPLDQSEIGFKVRHTLWARIGEEVIFSLKNVPVTEEGRIENLPFKCKNPELLQVRLFPNFYLNEPNRHAVVASKTHQDGIAF